MAWYRILYHGIGVDKMTRYPHDVMMMDASERASERSGGVEVNKAVGEDAGVIEMSTSWRQE